MRLQILLAAFTCTLGIASNASASLVADYRLDGDAVDDVSSNTAPSTDVTATADRFGTSGGALDFNGTTSIVRPLNIGLDDQTQDFSVSLWFRPNAVAGYQGLFSDSTGAASNINRWHSLGRLDPDGTLLFVVGAAQQSGAEIAVQTTGTVNASQWNHAAFRYDVTGGMATISVYLNGVFEGSSSKTFSPTPLATTETWRFAAQNNGSDVNFFGGALDDFQIYDHVLSVPEIQALAAMSPPNGPVVGWGYDSVGQATPTNAVNGVSGAATAMSSGAAHGCAIQAGTGNAVCWGADFDGQATPPDTVNGVSGTATSISGGNYHSCAIQAGTGNAVCWGYDFYGQATPPNTVNGVSGTATAIAAGYRHSCAIQAGTGNAVCWGVEGSWGQATDPDAVNGVSGTATAITAGDTHSCAIQAGTGNVICWGNNNNGFAPPPDAVNGVSGTAIAISAGGSHICAIQASTGNVVCWGWGIYGEATPPDAVNGVSGTATAISAGIWHSCAIQAGTNNAICWGADFNGQATPPDTVNGVSGTAKDIAAGADHTLAMVPEPAAWLAQPAGLALLCVLHRLRARKRRRLTVPL